MFDQFFQGVRGKFIRWILLLSIITGTITAVISYFSLQKITADIGKDFAIQYSIREKERILAPINREIEFCQTLVTLPALVKWANNENDPTLKQNALNELEAIRKHLRDSSLFVGIKSSSHYYYRDNKSDPNQLIHNYTMHPDSIANAWFYSTLNKIDQFDINVDYDPVPKKTMVWINTVVRDGPNKIAVAGAALNIDSFIHRLVHSDNGATASLLIDTSGAIRAHHNYKMIDQNTLTKDQSKRNTIYKLLPNTVDRIRLQDAIRSLHDNPDSVITMTLGYEGKKQLVALTYLPEIHWYILSTVDVSKDIHIATFAPIGIVAILALIVIVLSISLLLNRSVVVPLNKLTTSARRITDGNYTERVAIQSEDEIGELTRSFNHMLDTLALYTTQLERYGAELEDRVKERTIALEIEVQERNKAEQTAKAANQAKSEFLANMSHEIRTPMNAILGFSEILHEKLQDPRYREYVLAIHASGKSLLTLINDILDLSKVEAGKLGLEYTAIDPRRVLRDIETVFGRKIEEKNLEFLVNIDEKFPTAILLDEARLRQILLNLVGNAIKFTSQGSVKLIAKVEPTASDPSSLVFEVHDTGIGIPEDQLDNVFGAFEQQRGQSHAQFGGTGLGLTICKRLVELMGGEISVTSTVGKGSIFRIVLHNVEPALVIDSTMKSQQFDTKRIEFEHATILVAEDILLNRELIKGFLENHALRIVEAVNGKEAINLAKEFLPDLILMDIKMPEMGGLEAEEILRSDPATQKIPIVAVTASTLRSEEDIILQRFNGFVRKPMTRDDLLSVLCKFLPHTFIEAKQPTPDTEEVFFADEEVALVDLPVLKQKLEQQLLPLWQEVSQSKIVNNVVEFAEKVIDTGNIHHYSALAQWADKLRTQALLFDLDGMEATLVHFPQMCKLADLER